MPRIGDILHYKPKATGACSLAFVREVNADGTLDLVVFDSGVEEEFKTRMQPVGSGSAFMLLDGPAIAARAAALRPFMARHLDPAGEDRVMTAADRAFRDGGTVTFPGGCFVFHKTCGEAGERRCIEAEVGKWHRPEPRWGDWVIWGKEEYAHPAIVIQVGDAGPRLLKLWVLVATDDPTLRTDTFETSALYGTGHSRWRWPEEA